MLLHKNKVIAGDTIAFLVKAPVGSIVIWSGSADAVPKGWALCNGTNGTPDLSGRFVLGASEAHPVGETGGSEEVTLTIAQMPAHTHTIQYNKVVYASSEKNSTTSEEILGVTGRGNSNGGIISVSGGSSPHENMPPYYALCYIMKLTADETDGEAPALSVTQLVNAPIGAVLQWSGTEADVPEGWSVCNGENGTLDLRGKFVLAASKEHPVGETGGSEEVTLTVEQMPTHTHNQRFRPTIASGNVTTSCFEVKEIYPAGSTSNMSTTTAYTGGSQAHPNMPPYYTLLYIQKTGETPTDYMTAAEVNAAIDKKLEAVPAGSNVPAGGIIIWSGAEDAVPDGWALCDGSNNTPDLRGRFILGTSSAHAMGETGGAETVTLTVAQMPKHNHNIRLKRTGTPGSSGQPMASEDYGTTEIQSGPIVESGGSQPHDNMPPYYVLAYIMKL